MPTSEVLSPRVTPVSPRVVARERRSTCSFPLLRALAYDGESCELQQASHATDTPPGGMRTRGPVGPYSVESASAAPRPHALSGPSGWAGSYSGGCITRNSSSKSGSSRCDNRLRSTSWRAPRMPAALAPPRRLHTRMRLGRSGAI